MLPGESEKRSGARTNLFLGALLQSGSDTSTVRVRNLSQTGALLETTAELIQGASVMLRRGELSISGSVAWSGKGRAGIAFAGAIDLAAWLPRGTQLRQADVDLALEQLRFGAARDPVATSHELPADAILVERITEEMELVSRSLNLIGEELSGQGYVLSRHLAALQNLDLAAQTLVQLAKVLRAPALATGAQNVDVAALQKRLLRKAL